ncbi:ABC transporter ATP-binding protein/permease [Flavobacteriales bacterium]|nr:ABC transporter ATP-binding protein/permease [Flavobacteriales bacterium]
MLAGLLNLTLPLGIQSIINLIGGAQLSTSWVIMILLITVAALLSGIFQIIQLSITEKIQQRIFARTSFRFAIRIPRLKMEKLGNKHLPELMNRFFDTVTLQKGLSKLLLDFSAAVLQTVFGVLLLSLYHPYFIILGVSIIVVAFVIIRYTARDGMKTSMIESDYKYKMAFWLEESARNATTFKLAGVSDFILDKTNEIAEGYVKARKSHFKVLLSQYVTLATFKTFIITGLLVLGSLLVIDQRMNIGQFVASEIVIILIIGSVEKLMLSIETIYDVLTSVEKLDKIGKLDLEQDLGEDFNNFVKKEASGMLISANDLTFRYAGMRTDVIKNLNFTIKSNERICIAGFNNSGKSTLLQLISGLYTDFEGTITYNNIPIGNLNLESLRSHIGDSLAQETLFNGTLFDNISMGRDRANLQNVTWAIEQVGLTDFIEKLPKGYNTIIESHGSSLPQSIVRKIVLARSIADKPKLLVLEDTFFHLEKERMEKVKKLLFSKIRPWTLVIASNDIEIANACDKTLIVKDGEILMYDRFRKMTEEDWFHKVFV